MWIKNTNSSSWSPKITKKLNKLGNHHLLFVNKFTVRQEALLYLTELFTLTHLIKGEDYKTEFNGRCVVFKVSEDLSIILSFRLGH